MTTLRAQLTEAGFDWTSGRILYHQISDEAYSPGWVNDNEIIARKFIDFDDEILDKEFEEGYGAPNLPRFIAEDESFVYFPVQYDGATWVGRTAKNITAYLQNGSQTPYFGG